MSQQSVGIIGLGLMGTAISERLLAAGYEVHIWNRTREKAEPLLKSGARWSENPLADCDRVIISLYTTETVEQVLQALGSGLQPGQILIDTTTGEPEQTAALAARLSERGVEYLDAPISGSSEQTRHGEATTIVGGSPNALEQCRDLLECFSHQTLYAGPSGSGSKMKLVCNLVLGLNRAALAEGLTFAQSLGLEAQDALGVLMSTVAYSRTMDTKGPKMVEANFKTQARLSQHLKDVRLILESASAVGLTLPLSETHRQLLEAAEAAGYGEADNSAVIRAIQPGLPPK